jgi:hypothetical protein
MLLDDGRVFVGGAREQPEMFSPPYLFSGSDPALRPVITILETEFGYGEKFAVSVAGKTNIEKFVVIRPGAVTHGFDMEQRYVELLFRNPRAECPVAGMAGVPACVFEVIAPPHGYVAPPGHYMLFAVDTDGVPSEATRIRLRDDGRPRPRTCEPNRGRVPSGNWVGPPHVGGVGNEGDGAGVAIADVNANGTPDIIFMAYDDPDGANEFRYRIGWDIGVDGTPQNGWSGHISVGGVGHDGEGAGIAVADVDQNGTLDMVLMAYDAPTGQNNFRYRVGWDLQADGKPDPSRGWSAHISVGGLGHDGEGAGLAISDIDRNGKLDMLLMAYDAPTGANTFRYRIGWDLKSDGSATTWGGGIQVGGVGHSGQGAGVAIADLDCNNHDDLIFMAYDAPEGNNEFRYRIGWDVMTDGRVTGWSNTQTQGGLGHEGAGAGATLADIDGDGTPELLEMAYDDPEGGNSFRYRVGSF